MMPTRFVHQFCQAFRLTNKNCGVSPTKKFLETWPFPRFLYIRTIAYIVRRDGIWTNIGPLLYHYADVPHEISIELSWEEVRPYICKYFDILEEEHKVAWWFSKPFFCANIFFGDWLFFSIVEMSHSTISSFSLAACCQVARYTGNAEGLSSNRYNCIFFVANLGLLDSCWARFLWQIPSLMIWDRWNIHGEFVFVLGKV